MICSFKTVGKNLICENCGRKIDKTTDNKIPMAKCRIPDFYRLKSNYVKNVKIKGVGDTLSEIFKNMGYVYSPLGDVRARLTFLNKRGIKWCEENQIVILRWIQSECTKRNIELLPKTAHAILKLAIQKTKNQELHI